jgi:hypothetical protein
MGLDMYLNKRTYVQRWEHIKDAEQFAVTVTRGGKPFPKIKPERVSYVIEQVAYWRKANAIHQWFVTETQGGVDECDLSHVSREQLAELRDLCRKILNAPVDERDALAIEELPPTGGFFFGSTAVDDGYYEDLTYTADTIDALLADDTTDGMSGEYEYQASW